MSRKAVAVLGVAVVLTFGGAALALMNDASAEPGVAPAAQSDAPSQPAAPALDDPTIVAIFDAANTADIETGRLAVERGASKEVRDFGAMRFAANAAP